MQINQLKRKTKRARRVQVGRGGTRGKTSGRGHKGQRQHGGHGVRPDLRDMIKKLPKLRGRGVNSNKSIKVRARPINLTTLEAVFSDGDIVNPGTLAEKKLVVKRGNKLPRVKILAVGEITKKLNVEECEISAVAAKKIETAGGKVTAMKSRVVPKNKPAKNGDAKKKEVSKDEK